MDKGGRKTAFSYGMISCIMQRERVAVYIDGLNLFHALIKADTAAKYADVFSLVESLVKPAQELRFVKYFSAVQKHHSKNAREYKQYVKSLGDGKTEVITAHFKNKSKKCPSCNARWISQEEKETDVNMALAIFEDAMDNKYDVAIIISGDSDLVPPVKRIRERFESKTIVIATPPRRFASSRDLRRVAHASFEITLGRVRKHKII